MACLPPNSAELFNVNRSVASPSVPPPTAPTSSKEVIEIDEDKYHDWLTEQRNKGFAWRSYKSRAACANSNQSRKRKRPEELGESSD